MSSDLPNNDFDGAWKEALEHYLPEIVRFFVPDEAAQIAWQTLQIRDRELQQVAPAPERGPQSVDKLVEVRWQGEPEPIWILIHIDVQSQYEAAFAERMYRYHSRLYDQYRVKVFTLAILGDDRPSWKPDRFEYTLGSRMALSLRFPAVKLLDYRLEDLETDPNPCATMVLAHRAAQQTRRDAPARATLKWQLTRRLYRLGYDREQVVTFYRLIDWLLTLPPELDEQVWRQVQLLETENPMPYLAAFERRAREQGREEGREEEARESIRDIARLRFGGVSERLEALLQAHTTLDGLVALRRRVLLIGSEADLVTEQADPDAGARSPG